MARRVRQDRLRSRCVVAPALAVAGNKRLIYRLSSAQAGIFSYNTPQNASKLLALRVTLVLNHEGLLLELLPELYHLKL